jgi:2-succinyl-5-enolpyruvyl-6-hydroxy-3-cyclohexene-1-carboxylate synthase
VNGIDGVVSTVFGVGAMTSSIGYVGDVTMLHDVSALVEGVGEHGGSSVLVVSDNSGGGIFSFLSQGRELDHDEFEHLFGTPRSHDLVAVARAFGHAAESVSNVSEARGAIEAGLSREGVSVVVVALPDRRTNVETHEAVNEKISALLEASEF